MSQNLQKRAPPHDARPNITSLRLPRVPQTGKFIRNVSLGHGTGTHKKVIFLPFKVGILNVNGYTLAWPS